MTDDDLAEIEARVNAATPGRWWWSGNGKNLDLMSGSTTVMDFIRIGFQSAGPRFRDGGVMRSALDYVLRPEPHNPWRIVEIDHPDARLIANAPGDIRALLAEVRRLRSGRGGHGDDREARTAYHARLSDNDVSTA